MYKLGISLILDLLLATALTAQGKITRELYIETYSDIAMKEMVRTGIPASITLAQGCLESDNGNSSLTVDANNHFGIKCHEWTGKKIYHDDDEKDECFRKYKSAAESFFDHSDFLIDKARYKELFDLKQDDYKGWAKGLQKAGYATSKQYANQLISIIEANELYRYDEMVLKGAFKNQLSREKTISQASHREVLTNNRVEYIYTLAGDTPESLRDELNLYPGELYRYNNLQKGDKINPGIRIYLQPKRRKAKRGNEYHVVKEGETIWDISQEYAVKLNRLYHLNNLQEGSGIEEGDTLNLRNVLPHLENSETKDSGQGSGKEATDMKFQFE